MQNVIAEQSPRDLRVVTASYTPPFQHVPAEALGASWDFVANGLRAVKAQGDVPWNEDDVRRRLESERAGLYVCEDGFVILERDEEPVSMRPYLNVWIMYFDAGKGMPKREAILAWLDQMRVLKRCAFLQHTSPRGGWFGFDSGFAPYMTIWRRA